MSGTIKKLKLDKLVNYYENPRHAIGNDERDTLEKLFNAVGVQYMLNLLLICKKMDYLETSKSW